MKPTSALLGIPVLLATFVGCSSDDIAGPGDNPSAETVLLDVVPQGGASMWIPARPSRSRSTIR